MITLIVLAAASASGGGAAAGTGAARVEESAGRERFTDPFDGRQVTSVSLFGARRTSRELILRRFGIAEGEPFSRSAVDEGLRRVIELGGIEYATYRVLSNRDRSLSIILEVTERPARRIVPLFERQVTPLTAFGLGYDDDNFRGNDERLGASILLRDVVVVEAHWLAPRIAGSSWFGIGCGARWEDYEYPYPDFQGRFTDPRIGRLRCEVSLVAAPSRHVTFSLSPGIESIHSADPMFVNRGSGAFPDAPSGVFPILETAVTAGALNRVFFPTRGAVVRAARTDWGLLQRDAAVGNHQYVVSGEGYLCTWKLVWALRAKAVLTQGSAALLQRSHLGGEATIRGWEFGAFSGDNCLFEQGELRVPLNFGDIDDMGNPIVLVGLSLFLDAGACWDRGEELDPELFHSGFGFALDFMPVTGLMLRAGCAWHRRSNGRLYLDALISY